MFKFLAPASVLTTVILLAGSALFHNESIANPEAVSIVRTDTLSNYQYNKVENIETCRDEKIGVYFHDEYLTYHSAEIVNEALSSSKSCDIHNLTVEIFDIADDLQDSAKIKDEVGAYLYAHGLAEYADYDIELTELTPAIYNGRLANISFEFAKETQEVSEKAS